MFKNHEASFSQSSYTTYVNNMNVKQAIKDTSMKEIKNSDIDFSSQKIFIGIDVHKKHWIITIQSNQVQLKTFSMNPSAEELAEFVKKRYPGGDYYSVYEAGFCGYWINKELNKYGIKNIIVNPADVPTSNKEKLTKTDKIDSRKLARELENQTMKTIYVPTEQEQQLRSLCRLRYSLTKDQVRVKNRIKGHLYFYGKQMPEGSKYWSGKFLGWLRELEFSDPLGKQYLSLCLDELIRVREKILAINKELRKAAQENQFGQVVKKLYQTVPGIGFTSAITLLTEIIDMKRFSNIEKLSSYVGLVPSISASGQREQIKGLTVRKNKYLRYLLIESAWIAIKQDKALFQYYCSLTKRMNKKRAIISVARKLLNRIRHVWLTDEEYKTGFVK
jgi:transposase